MSVEEQQRDSVAIGSQFAALRKVWAFEIADIDDRLVLGDKDGFRRWHEHLEKKVDRNTQNMFLNLIPGGTTVAALAAVAGAAIDGVKDLDLTKSCNDTERLLASESMGVSKLNLDSVEYLLAHCVSWLMPLLQGRIESLQAVARGDGPKIALERLSLYETALAEVQVAIGLLNDRLEEHRQKWQRVQESYLQAFAEVKRLHEAKLNEVQLLSKALLIDRATAEAQVEKLENSFRDLRCSHTALLVPDCERLAIHDGLYCPEHKCFEENCQLASEKGSHYCRAHGRELDHVEAFFPKYFASLGIKPAKPARKEPRVFFQPTLAEPERPRSTQLRTKSRFQGAKVFLLISLLAVLIYGVAYVSGLTDSKPSAVPVALATSTTRPTNPPAPRTVSTREGTLEAYLAFHDTKSYAEWDEDDMVKAIEILAQARSDSDRLAIEKATEEIEKEECSTGSCFIHQREFAAAKKLRSGEAKTPREALGI